MALINVGGRMFDSSTKFRINDGYGGYETTAAQAAHWIARNKATQDYKSTTGWSTYEGGVDALGEPVKEQQQKKPAPRAEAPARRSSGGGSRRSAPSKPSVDKMFKKLDSYKKKKANDAIPDKDGGGDPYGIEDTKLNQLAPERVKRSFLTNQPEPEPAAVSGTQNDGTQNGSTPEEGRSFLSSGRETGYSYHQVVDPATGKAYESASAAKAAGITNWVYKFQYDRKNRPENLISDMIAGEQNTGTAPASEQSYAQAGLKWRDRYSSNRWFA